MQTNLHGIVELTQQVGARMIARGAGGKIIMIGSLMSLLGLPYLTVYAMTKGALGQLTKALAAEWGRLQHPGELHRAGLHHHRSQPRRCGSRAAMREWLKGAQANPQPGHARGHRAAGGVSGGPRRAITSPARSSRWMADTPPRPSGRSNRRV